MKKSNSIPSIFSELNDNIEQYLTDNEIKSRNGTSPGLWLCFILPLSVILGTWNHTDCSPFYRSATCLSVGLMLNSLTIIFQVNHSTQFRTACCAVNSITTTLLLCYFSEHNLFLNIIFGVLCSFGYSKLLLQLLQEVPGCFTFGEAAVVVQAGVLFVASFVGSVFCSTPTSCIDISTKILQVGFAGLGILCYSVYYFPQLRNPTEFYSAVAITLITIAIFLHILLGFSAVLWIINLLVEDVLTMKLVLSWVVFAGLAVAAACSQVKAGQKATTVVRKYFHLLALLVYLPGILLKPCLLYIASGITLALFIGIEMTRLIKLPVVGPHLNAAFGVFSDEKDSAMALTPIYLQIGCSAPLWLHPAPAPAEAPETLLPLLAGLISVGVGDTAASVCGSYFGQHHWPDSQRTKEGSAACFISQLFFVIALIHFGYIPRNNLLQPIAAIAAVSLLEATTDQIDNLALPLVMYVMLL